MVQTTPSASVRSVPMYDMPTAQPYPRKVFRTATLLTKLQASTFFFFATQAELDFI